MFEKFEKTAVVEFDLCAAGPVVISSGKNNELDPRLPDMSFLSGNDGNTTAFVIPGSTIKGVIRGFVYNEAKLKRTAVNEETLFGRAMGEARKSKISFHDAYADMSTTVSNIRHSTALDPILQSAKRGSLNNVQVVEKGTFKAGFKLINYSHDELEIIMRALSAVNDGRLRFGGRTSRGYGMMRVENFHMTIYNGFDENLNRKIEKEYSGLDEYIQEVYGNV